MIEQRMANLRLGYKFLTPINLNSEKRQFFLSQEYNPQFKYFSRIPGFIKNVKSLETDFDGADSFPKIYKDKLRELKLQMRVMEAFTDKNDNRFTKAALRLYGIPSKKSIDFATSLLSKKSEENGRTIKSDKALLEIEQFFRSYLPEQSERYAQFFGKQSKLGAFIKWKFTTGNHVARAVVSTSNKKVSLRSNSVFSRQELERLKVHEIGTHVLRSIMAEVLGLPPIFSTGLAGYESTEEGLAVYNEMKHDIISWERMRIVAARAIAAREAIRSSFREIFNQLIELGLGGQEAWEVTVRVKRGLRDTSKEGGFTKDHVYLSGFLDILEFLEKYGKQGEMTLYAGKIPIRFAKRILT
ncbi:MAG: DUF1704 domain-containing protein, partial [Candidatus Altiarchaeota archaeon]|nr:DUF1704 domain-containing protein [Candidatus Altiarchaeota archaeon]